MKIVALLGSPHGLKGNTARLLNILLEGARSQGATTEIIVINTKKVAPCLACDACHIKGRCPQKDEFEAIKQKIQSAEALIMASPNYVDYVSAQLKAFMDRCCSVVHCHGFEGRYGAAVVTSGGGGEEPVAKALHSFLIKTGIRPVGEVWAKFKDVYGEDIPQEIAEKALTLGKDLVRAVKNKAKIRKADKQILAHSERVEKLVQYQREVWPYEYQCWQQKKGKQ